MDEGGVDHKECTGRNGHCKDHKGLVAAASQTQKISTETKETVIGIKKDVEWLVAEVRNGNGKALSK